MLGNIPIHVHGLTSYNNPFFDLNLPGFTKQFLGLKYCAFVPVCPWLSGSDN